MKINLISIMPGLVEGSLNQGVVGRSFQDNKNQLNIINPRQFTGDVHQTVDDRPYGGGDGMLMLAEPMAQSLESIPADERGPVLITSPQGKLFNDQWAEELSQQSQFTIICSRYGGVDQRFLNKFPEIQEVSIGDYVLSGGELAAAVIIDSVVRKIPGVLGHVDSAKVDSFSDQGLLEGPYFTRPQEWRGQEVPEPLMSGHHQRIQEYRQQLNQLVTLQKRPELVSSEQGVDWQKLHSFLQGLSDAETESLGLQKDQLLKAVEQRLK